ncbi:hypothetical protein [Alteromonas sp. ASW11-130]|uniref:hypothetical protein n=1 Tax=Alteromonas sp. ASW11-130 TaxID=3015775 RepID=UPI00224250B4|nr:hypothetical protein [Alteromonas sp. ASW11-130]MCW8093387.1 hypothetical protein [Alteromonas sp. ASW11-130]
MENEIVTIATLLGLLIGVLCFYYRAMYQTDIRRKYQSLSLECQHPYNKVTVADCVIKEDNYSVLSSFFYKVQLIESFIKKIIPIMVIVMLFTLIFSFNGKDTFSFKVEPKDNIQRASVTLDENTREQLSKGNVLFQDNKGNYYLVDTKNRGGLFSVSSTGMKNYSLPIIVISVGLIITILLMFAHHVFKGLENYFLVQLAKNREGWQKVCDEVDDEIKRVTLLCDGDCKEERLIALEKKRKFYNEFMEELKAFH